MTFLGLGRSPATCRSLARFARGQDPGNRLELPPSHRALHSPFCRRFQPCVYAVLRLRPQRQRVELRWNALGAGRDRLAVRRYAPRTVAAPPPAMSCCRWAWISRAAAAVPLPASATSNLPAREGDITMFGQAPGSDLQSDRWNINMLSAAPYAFAEVYARPLDPDSRISGFEPTLIDGSLQQPHSYSRRLTSGTGAWIRRGANLRPWWLARMPNPRLSIAYRGEPQADLHRGHRRLRPAARVEDLNPGFGNPNLSELYGRPCQRRRILQAAGNPHAGCRSVLQAALRPGGAQRIAFPTGGPSPATNRQGPQLWRASAAAAGAGQGVLRLADLFPYSQRAQGSTGQQLAPVRLRSDSRARGPGQLRDQPWLPGRRALRYTTGAPRTPV